MAGDAGGPGGGAAGGLTNISISGTVGLGDGSGTLFKYNTNYEYDQALSWVRGRHQFKFGGEARVADLLHARGGASAEDRRAIEEALDAEVELLWLTAEVRTDRPTVLD